MQAVILLAGYGSRLNRNDIPHKSMLPIGKDTLLSRHLISLQELNIEKVILVVGYNRKAVKDYVYGLNLRIPVEFVDNELYRTTGNTLSLVMGLRGRKGDFLILDGDVFYPHDALKEYFEKSQPSSFAVVPVEINDTEATKVLLNGSNKISSLITKRDLTTEEKNQYKVAGEAIGFFLLNEQAVNLLIEMYDQNESEYIHTLWEIPFSNLAKQTKLTAFDIGSNDCVEIDTEDDYKQALQLYESQREIYDIQVSF